VFGKQLAAGFDGRGIEAEPHEAGIHERLMAGYDRFGQVTLKRFERFERTKVGAGDDDCLGLRMVCLFAVLG